MSAPYGNPGQAPMNANGQPQQKDDYLDKGVGMVQKKYFGGAGGDPAKNKARNEKITDAIRSIFEKLTGKKVPKAISN